MPLAYRHPSRGPLVMNNRDEKPVITDFLENQTQCRPVELAQFLVERGLDVIFNPTAQGIDRSGIVASIPLGSIIIDLDR